MSNDHMFILGQSFMSDDFDASCSCGWGADGFESRADAQEAWENHCDVVFMEATWTEGES